MKSAGSLQQGAPLYVSCRKISIQAPFRWLAKGWQDYRRAPLHSLVYGFIFAAIGGILVLFSQYEQNYFLAGLLVSVLIIGPALAFGMYDISRLLEENQEPSFVHQRTNAIRQMGRVLMLIMLLSLTFLVLLLVTPMVQSMFSAAKPFAVTATVPLSYSDTLFVYGAFAYVLFWVSMFALPMILGQDADAMTAITSSIYAVWRNKWVLSVWALVIVGLTLVGFATALIGFILIVPLLGYATWHGYRETILSE